MDIAALLDAGAVFGVIGAVLAPVLRRAYRPPRTDTMAERIELIDALLPQTQCGYCGHAGCRPYAQAIAEGEAINRCPPGGTETIAALAAALDREALPLDGEARPKTVAFIRELECIGCTKCIQACPVDAILGAAKRMHTVLADECTGCDLCVEPCPVDCIEMRPTAHPTIDRNDALRYKARFEARNTRLQRDAAEREQRRATSRSTPAPSAPQVTAPVVDKQAEIRAAIARAKARKAGQQTPPTRP